MLNFLTKLLHSGASYSSINTAKAALSSSIIVKNEPNWINNKNVIKFMKGVFNSRPPVPKYTNTWDVDEVLSFIETKLCNTDISLKKLTLKTVMLIALTSGQRAQSIHEMDLNFCHKQEQKFIFEFNVPLKTSKPGNYNLPLSVIKNTNQNLCPYNSLCQYLELTKNLRKNSKVWIGYKKPHHSVSRQSISRWLKCLLCMAGVDKKFTGHSTRHASTSKASLAGLGLTAILKTAHWRQSSNFFKFYKKDIVQQADYQQEFAEAVLRKK